MHARMHAAHVRSPLVHEAASLPFIHHQAASGRGILMCKRLEWAVPAYAPVPEEGACVVTTGEGEVEP